MSNDAPAALETAANDASIDPLSALEFGPRVGKRAVYEEFTFEPRAGGDVDVTNDSHGDDGEDHSYTVHVTSGIPADCTCPAWEYHEGACKHMVATALRPALCDVVDADSDVSDSSDGSDSTDQPVATDGGTGVVDADDADDVVDLSEETGERIYTYHYEPYEQGGARYVRCELCGAECVPADPDRLAHFDGCPEGRR